MLIEFSVMHFWVFLSPGIVLSPTQTPDGPPLIPISLMYFAGILRIYELIPDGPENHRGFH